MIDPHSAEGASLAVRIYLRIRYLMAEGFTEDQAHDIAEREYDL